MRKVLSAFIVFAIYSAFVNAQGLDYQWRNEISTKEWNSRCLDNLNDSEGNSYFLSSIVDTVAIITNQEGRRTETKPTTIVLRKVDSSGKTQWTQNFRDEAFYSGAIDDLGNLFYLGARQDSFQNTQFFLRKFFPNGILISETQLFSPISQERMRGCRVNNLLVDHQGDVFLSGVFSDSLSTNYTLKEKKVPQDYARNYADAFITKLDKNGKTLWYKNILGGGHKHVHDAVIDINGNVYIVGTFSNRIRLDDQVLEAKGGADSFIFKVSNTGETLHFQLLSGSGYDRILGVAVDDQQNMYFAGHYDNQLNFDSKNQKQLYQPVGTSDAFLLKLDSAWNFKWVRTIGDKYHRNESYSVQLIDDKVYWTGKFKGHIDFDPSNTIKSMSSEGNEYNRHPTPFIQTYTTNGDFLDVLALKEYSAYEFQLINIRDQATYQIIGRHYMNREKPNQYYSLAVDQHTFDIPNDSILNITACDSYYWELNNTNYTKSGVYISENPISKKSVELHLTIYTMNLNVKFDGETIESKEVDATYQWLNCANGCEIIPNATGRSFTPRKTGDYCVQLTSNMCDNIDTSKVRHIEILDLDKETLDQYYEANSEITIEDIEKVHLPLDGDKVKMIPFRVDKYFGFVKNGDPNTWIVEPKFEQVFAVYETGAIVKDSTTEGYGFIDNTGKYVILPYFKQITREQNVLHGTNTYVSNSELHLPPSHNRFNYHAFFDMSGKAIFEERAHDQGNFSGEDLAWFRFGKEVHIRDLKGSLIDSFQLDSTREFLGIANANLVFKYTTTTWTDEIKAFSLDGKKQFEMPLNTHGKVYKINDQLFGVSDPNDYSYYLVDQNGKSSIYSFDETAVGDQLLSNTYFKQDYFILRNRNLNNYGVIHRSGRIVIPFNYKRIDVRVNGYWACFDERGRAEFIDSTGKVAFTDKEPMIFGYGRNRNHYLLAGSKGFYDDLSFAWRQYYTMNDQGYGEDSSYYYYYDFQGNEAFSLDTSILLTGNFSEGLAPVVTTSKGLGFINKSGEIVIQPKYELVVAGGYLNMFFVIPRFEGGFSYIKSHKGYIDKNGKEYFSGKRMQDHYDFSH